MKINKKRIFDIIQMQNTSDTPSIAFNVFIAIIIFLNLFVTLFSTFDESLPYTNILKIIEFITIIILCIEYILRLWTAEFLYPKKNSIKSKVSFIFSFYGIIDLLTFVPYFLPVVFPSGAVAFRMLRVVRIFHIFKLRTNYDAFSVISDVLNEKKDQIISCICLILILMIASSLCMYGLEHEAQPDKFQNAFSGIWWSVSTLLTVGYGDIYPVTTLGKIMAIIISFLGVGMVAIPTGIISAGFVEQYAKLKNISLYYEENSIRFVTLLVDNDHQWKNIKVKDTKLPDGLILTLIIRDDDIIVPKGDTLIKFGDKVVIGAETFKDEIGVELKELIIKEKHPWVGKQIKDLDISRQTLIITIKRKNKVIIPNGNTFIKKGDLVIVYSKHDILGSIEIDL